MYIFVVVPLIVHYCVMNPAGPSPSELHLSIEVDRASWIATVLLMLGWLLAYR
jgi:hypothetical protein